MLNWLKRLFKRKPEETTPVTCPYCGTKEFYGGPSGGMSTNIMCANPKCEHWFNWHQGIIPMDDLHQVGSDRRPC